MRSNPWLHMAADTISGNWMCFVFVIFLSNDVRHEDDACILPLSRSLNSIILKFDSKNN